MRYLYQLDLHYGYLASLEHPLSILLLPTLCIVKCLERRKKREEINEFVNNLLNPEEFDKCKAEK